MTFTEISIQDAAERRLAASEIDWSPNGSQPTKPRDDYDNLLWDLERRANLIELIVSYEKAIERAYESGAESRIAWARGEGRENLRVLRGSLLSCEATIKHLCQEIGKEAK